jgi:outer membrane usher protein FimD/PapC
MKTFNTFSSSFFEIHSISFFYSQNYATTKRKQRKHFTIPLSFSLSLSHTHYWGSKPEQQAYKTSYISSPSSSHTLGIALHRSENLTLMKSSLSVIHFMDHAFSVVCKKKEKSSPYPKSTTFSPAIS